MACYCTAPPRSPAEVQAILHNEIMVARGSAREARQRGRDRVGNRPHFAGAAQIHAGGGQADRAQLRKQIREMVRGDLQLVPPSYERSWKIDLGLARHSLAGKPLPVGVKFNAANKSASGTYGAWWQIGDPKSPNVVRLAPVASGPGHLPRNSDPG